MAPLTWPRWSFFVLSALHGGGDGLDLPTCFLLVALMGAVFLLLTPVFWPWKAHKADHLEVDAGVVAMSLDYSELSVDEVDVAEAKYSLRRFELWKESREWDWKKQLMSPIGLGAITTSATYLLRQSFLLGTFKDQLDLLDEGGTRWEGYGTAWDLFLPIGALISVVLGTVVLDRRSLGTSFFFFAVFQMVYSVANTIPSLPMQIVVIIVFPIVRSYFYAALSTLVAVVFGFKNFGTVYGVVIVVAGVFSLLSYLCTFLVVEVFDRDYLVMNLVLTVTCLQPFHFAWQLWRKRGALLREFDQGGAKVGGMAFFGSYAGGSGSGSGSWSGGGLVASAGSSDSSIRKSKGKSKGKGGKAKGGGSSAAWSNSSPRRGGSSISGTSGMVGVAANH